MQLFLDKTAEFIIHNFKEDIDRICVVLPNRRAGLFLKRSLSRFTPKAIWAPQIYAIEDFILELSGFRVMDPVYLQFELYKIYKSIEEEPNVQPFDEFIKWGRSLLNDFNEVDMYLVDPKQLFGHLTDEKALSLWNPENKSLTKFQLNYLKFYNSLNTFYNRLSEELIRKNEVYQGLAYRRVVQNIESISQKMTWQKIVFAGFNALTRAEQQIISSLEKAGKAIILFDSDAYYIEDDSQEAGKFIRPVFQRSDKEQFKWLENNFKESGKVISLIGVPQSIGQVKVAGELIRELLKTEAELNQTAVVLNDESVFEALMNSIPIEAGKFNLTMGLPLKSTPLFRLIDAIFELQINSLKFKGSNDRKPKIYFRDLLRILEHPNFRELLFPYDIGLIANTIRNSNRIFLDYEDFSSAYFAPPQQYKSIAYIFKHWDNNPVIALECLLGLMDEMKMAFLNSNQEEGTDQPNAQLEIEYLFHFHKALQKLALMVNEFPFIQNLNILRSIFMQVVQMNLPFYGEPLQGLQLMGMLETQTLDFKNVILLGVNEDYIPSGKSTNSFIPFDIRRKFSMPTYHDKNAVYAYHFYRLIQRAEKINILYSTEPGELGGGDKSRFISQLEYEMPKFNPDIKIEQKILSVPLKLEQKDDAIVIEKSPELITKLSQLAIKGFSASAFNTYRNCPLQYYFRYIAGIDEIEEPEETIEAGTLGSVIHDALALMYKPYEDKLLWVEDVKKMKSQIDILVSEGFKKKYKGGDIEFGKNHLIAKVATQYVSAFLDSEISSLNNERGMKSQPTIRNIEKPFFTSFNFKMDNLQVVVKLMGIFDRVDELDGMIRIIDYKSGKVEPNDLRIREWDELTTERKLDKSFQLLFYTYLYYKDKQVNPGRIMPGIISFRNISKGLMTLTLPGDEVLSSETLLKFESQLEIILSELFNSDIPFRQTNTVENCRYCAFASVCNRN